MSIRPTSTAGTPAAYSRKYSNQKEGRKEEKPLAATPPRHLKGPLAEFCLALLLLAPPMRAQQSSVTPPDLQEQQTNELPVVPPGGNPFPLVDIAPQPPAPSNPYGVSDQVWQKVCANPKTAATLASMPQSVVDAYRQMSDKRKLDFEKNLQRSMGGVSFRSAFVGGHFHILFFPEKTFNFLQGQLDKANRQGKVSPQDYAAGKNLIDALKPLTPDQREAFAALLDADTAAMSAPEPKQVPAMPPRPIEVPVPRVTLAPRRK